MSLFIPSATVHVTPQAAMPPMPEPVPDPVGWHVHPGDGQTPARVRHDSVMRDTGADLQQTNEIFPLRPYDGMRVDWRSKVTFKLGYCLSWQRWFQELLGPWVWDRFIKKGFGWCDFPVPNTGLSFNMLDCGGNLRNVIDKVGGWGIVQSWNVAGWPDTTKTYRTSPHLFMKQVLVGKSEKYNPYWVVDKGQAGGCGDVVIPCVADTLAAHPLNQLEFFPALPFAATLSGTPVIVEGYCFSGSNTYVLVSGAWYCAEEMIIVGNVDDKSLGGSWLDRRVYIKPWVQTCPPPVIGWTRQG